MPSQEAQVARQTAIVMLIVGLAMIVVPLANVLLLIFAAILVAALILIAAKPFRRMGAPQSLAVLLGFTLIIAVIGGAGWLFGSQISAQLGEISAQLPGAIANARRWIATLPFGSAVASGTPDLQSYAGQAMTIAFGAFGAVTNFILVIIAAVYLAMQPRNYLQGLERLFPKSATDQIGQATAASGVALQNYLIGQFVTMAVLGVLVWAGLMLVGVPSAGALALIAGLANFVPLIGPFLGAVPGILIAFAQGPDIGLAAGMVYLIAQQIEGNVLTPIVQRWAVSIPPALLLFALAGLGTLFGIVGVILAAPLAVVLYTLVTVLWTREALGYDVAIPGDEKAQSADAT